MTGNPELDEWQLGEFERNLLMGSAIRISAQELWRALAHVLPHRVSGPAERRLLLYALRVMEKRGSIRLPSERGRRWDRSMDPPVPISVDVVRERSAVHSFDWRAFPWHPQLHWVAQCRSLSQQQVEFLRRVHAGLVDGAFRELAPLKYRSLQLTGDEKMLASLMTTSLFAPTRLTLELLGCMPDALPLAWEVVGDGGRMLIFENAGPFAVARRVLVELAARPYDLVAYGGGRSILAALGHIRTIECRTESIHYVGDLDHAGLDIAWKARGCCKELGLPTLQPASELHSQMLSAAEAFGYPQGWPTRECFSEVDRRRVLDVVAPETRDRVEALLSAGCRIPEEVLGPHELRNAWSL